MGRSGQLSSKKAAYADKVHQAGTHELMDSPETPVVYLPDFPTPLTELNRSLSCSSKPSIPAHTTIQLSNPSAPWAYLSECLLLLTLTKTSTSNSPYSKAKILHPLKREKETWQDITKHRIMPQFSVSAGNVFRPSVIWCDRLQKKLPQPRKERATMFL